MTEVSRAPNQQVLHPHWLVYLLISLVAGMGPAVLGGRAPGLWATYVHLLVIG